LILAGVAYSLFLVSTIPGPVFANGDLGVKFLLTRQFETDPCRLELRLPAEPWVEHAWDAGLYPLVFPFVVERDGGRVALFSFVFSWLSAPFHRALGYRGLYVLPLVSLWVIWYLVLKGCRSLGCRPGATAGGLFAAVLASPLACYGAVFWEHTPAVALALGGAVPLLTRARLGKGQAFSTGLALGLAPLLRDEMLLLSVVVGAVLAHARLRGRPNHLVSTSGVALAGLGLATFAAAATNVLAFGTPLGIHAAAVADLEWTGGAARGVVAALGLFQAFLVYFPCVLAAPLAIHALRRGPRDETKRRALLTVAIGLAFLLLVPPAVRIDGGMQWGPRYLLAAMPLLAIGGAKAFDRGVSQAGATRRVSGLLVLGLLGWGAAVNAGGIAPWLIANYARRMTAYEAVAAAPQRIIAVSHQYVTQQLAALTEARRFFLTPRPLEQRQLVRALRQHHVKRFLYVCDQFYPCVVTGPSVGPHTFYVRGDQRRPLYVLRLRTIADRYALYDGTVVRRSRGARATTEATQ
jgi:hypothetical protein